MLRKKKLFLIVFFTVFAVMVGISVNAMAKKGYFSMLADVVSPSSTTVNVTVNVFSDDAKTKPLSGVEVDILNLSSGKIVQWVLTNTEGKALFYDLEKGKYDIRAVIGPECSVSLNNKNITSNAVFDLVGKCSGDEPVGQGTVRGWVRDKSDGTKIDSAKVEINTSPKKSVTTDIQDVYSFVFDNVSVGTYDVTTSVSGYRSMSKQTSVSESSISDLVFELNKTDSGDEDDGDDDDNDDISSPQSFNLFGKVTLSNCDGYICRNTDIVEPIAGISATLNCGSEHYTSTKSEWKNDLGNDYSDFKYNYNFDNITYSPEEECQLSFDGRGDYFIFQKNQLTHQTTFSPESHLNYNNLNESYYINDADITDVQVIDRRFTVIGSVYNSVSNNPLEAEIAQRSSYGSGYSGYTINSKEEWLGETENGLKYNFEFYQTAPKSENWIELTIPDNFLYYIEGEENGKFIHQIDLSKIEYSEQLKKNIYYAEFPLSKYIIRVDRTGELINKEILGYPIVGTSNIINNDMSKEDWDTLENMIKVLESLRVAAKDKRKVPIYIGSSVDMPSSAMAIPGKSFFGEHPKLSSPFIALSLEIMQNNRNISILIHEYFHIIDFYSEAAEDDSRYKFDNILIKGNVERARHLYDRYKCCDFVKFDKDYPTYALTNRWEFWAEFGSWWYLNNDEFVAAISDDEIPAICRQVLKFMYEALRQNFPGITPYKKIGESSGLIKQKDRDYQYGIIENAVMASSGNSVSNVSTDEVNEIMNRAGYAPVKSVLINRSIAPLNEVVFTEYQIANGFWQFNKYRETNIYQQMKVYYQIFVSKIKLSSVSKNSRYSVKKLIAVYNNTYNNFLKFIGKYSEVGSVHGKVIDQNNRPVGDIVVSVGNKMTTAKRWGYYKIKGLPEGKQYVDSIIDLSNGENYKVISDRFINIRSSRWSSETIKIRYPLARIIGRIVGPNNQPLSNAKVGFIGYNGDKIWTKTDSKGEFVADGLYYNTYLIQVINSGGLKRYPKQDTKYITPLKTVEIDKKSFSRVHEINVVVNKQ